MLANTLKVLALCAALTTTVYGRAFTPQDLVGLSRVANPAVSSDGRWLAWEQVESDVATNKTHHLLWTLDLNTPGAQAHKLPSSTDSDDSAPAFGPDGELYFLSDRSAGKSAVWRVAVRGGTPSAVTGAYDLAGFKVSPTGDAIVVWADRPVGATSLDSTPAEAVAGQGSARIYDQLFVRHWNAWADGQRSQLFVIPLQHGSAPGPGHAIEGALVGDTPQKPRGGGEQIAWSRDGRAVYFALREAGRIESISSNLDIFVVPADASAPPSNLTAENPATDTLPSVSPDGHWLAWVAMKRPGYEDDRRVVMLREFATGKTRALTEGWDRSVDSIAWAADSASLYVTAKDNLDAPAFRIALSDGKPVRLTGAGHVGAVVPLPSGGIIFALDSLTAPTDIWRRDLAGKTIALSHANAAKLAGIDWPLVYRFSFRGAQGEDVWGLTLRPANLPRDAKAPVAFLVHGGPESSFADAWSYGWNFAAWAGHGYAVVSVDFHGSTGYGQAFTDAVIGDWGGKPLDDLQAGLKAATERFGFLDAARVCAAGGSYGGYMMNWIEGKWPERFKCLVQHDGVFDARAFAYETDELWPDEWDHGSHAYYEAPIEFEKWNPVNTVAAWKTPQLVITGEHDFRTPDTQAIAAFTALQRRAVPSRLLVFPDEGHWVSKAKNSLQWYEEVFRWMDRWTGSAG